MPFNVVIAVCTDLDSVRLLESPIRIVLLGRLFRSPFSTARPVDDFPDFTTVRPERAVERPVVQHGLVSHPLSLFPSEDSS